MSASRNQAFLLSIESPSGDPYLYMLLGSNIDSKRQHTVLVLNTNLN
jgi:hypothetical protein